MKIHTLEQEQLLPISMDDAWDFFSSAANLNEITPDDMADRFGACGAILSASHRGHNGGADPAI